MSTQTPFPLPRITITYCTQCRWLLRAAYFAQELLTTFSTQIGEVALIPATGGLFRVEMIYALPPNTAAPEAAETVTIGEITATKVLVWDRKEKGGFPETKVLKQLVRDCIDPAKDLGHSDRHGKKEAVKSEEAGQAKEEVVDSKGTEEGEVKRNADGTVCEDCN